MKKSSTKHAPKGKMPPITILGEENRRITNQVCIKFANDGPPCLTVGAMPRNQGCSGMGLGMVSELKARGSMESLKPSQAPPSARGAETPNQKNTIANMVPWVVKGSMRFAMTKTAKHMPLNPKAMKAPGASKPLQGAVKSRRLEDATKREEREEAECTNQEGSSIRRVQETYRGDVCGCSV
jgi:hypothetical protein